MSATATGRRAPEAQEAREIHPRRPGSWAAGRRLSGAVGPTPTPDRPRGTDGLSLLAQLAFVAGSSTFVAPWPVSTFVVLLTVSALLTVLSVWLTGRGVRGHTTGRETPPQLPTTIAIYDSAVTIVVQVPPSGAEGEPADGDEDFDVRRGSSPKAGVTSKKARSRS